MNKSPAFQFYASDFLVDTAEMTNQEVGVYIRLLSHQWVNGNLNGDPNRLANVVGIDLLEVWPEIKHKFELGEDGRLKNPKLEKVRQTQIDYRAKQSEAGKRGAAKRWDSNPNSNPNSEKVALQSSSSSSSSSLGSTPKIKPTAPQAAQNEIKEIFHFWKTTLNHPRSNLDDKRKTLIKRHLKSGYSVQDLKHAIIGCSQTPHNMGDNDRGQVYDSLELILRTSDHIDRFMRNSLAPPISRGKGEKRLNSNIEAAKSVMEDLK